MQKMLRQILRRWGVLGMTILITAVSVLISVLLRIIIQTVLQDRQLLISDLTQAVLIPLIIAPIMAIIFARLLKEIDDAEQRNARLVIELQEALTKTKTLSGLLPICASCKKIRDDAGYWHQVEVYIRDHAEVDFSHGLCPDCSSDLSAQIAAYKNKSVK
jgi:hypothetical protein